MPRVFHSGRSNPTHPEIQTIIIDHKSSKRRKVCEAVTEVVPCYLAKDMVPFKAVENAGFKTLMHTLDALYDLI